MNDRVHAFVGAMILTMALVACVLVKLTPAAPKKITLDPKNAVVAVAPYVKNEQDGQVTQPPRAWFVHECCDCGNSHIVLMVAMEDGIEMYWWADNDATRKARWRKGLTVRNPWVTENDPWRDPER